MNRNLEKNFEVFSITRSSRNSCR